MIAGAHVAGIPLEELLVLLYGGGATWFAVRALLSRLAARARRAGRGSRAAHAHRAGHVHHAIPAARLSPPASGARERSAHGPPD